MAFRRRRSSRKMKRRPVKRRRMTRSKLIRMRNRKNLLTGNLVHTRMEVPIRAITNGSTLDQYELLVIRAADCSNITAYGNLYDQFRINKVVVKFVPTGATMKVIEADSTNVPGSGVRTPTLATCIDYDSESTGTVSLTDMKNYASYREVQATKPHTRVFRPAVLLQAYRNATSTAYIPKFKQFIDCNQLTTGHFGLRWYLEAGTPAAAYSYDLRIKVYMSFKNRRTG